MTVERPSVGAVVVAYPIDRNGLLGYNDLASISFVKYIVVAVCGAYTLTVGLKTADKNIVLSNTSVQYKINGITLSLVWTDEDGNEGDEFTFEYDSEKHGVNFVLSGVITGDTVEPYVTYA